MPGSGQSVKAKRPRTTTRQPHARSSVRRTKPRTARCGTKTGTTASATRKSAASAAATYAARRAREWAIDGSVGNRFRHYAQLRTRGTSVRNGVHGIRGFCKPHDVSWPAADNGAHPPRKRAVRARRPPHRRVGSCARAAFDRDLFLPGGMDGGALARNRAPRRQKRPTPPLQVRLLPRRRPSRPLSSCD